MSHIISAVLLFFILSSCREVKQNNITEREGYQKSSFVTTSRPGYKHLSEVVTEREILRFWAAAESYYPTLHFINRDTAYLEFNGQCEYTFPIKMENDNIIVYWELTENCTHDIGIKKSFGLKDRPVKGKPFISLRLLDDTTLQAAYVNKEWVKYFNREYEGYKYLPDRFLSVGD